MSGAEREGRQHTIYSSHGTADKGVASAAVLGANKYRVSQDSLIYMGLRNPANFLHGTSTLVIFRNHPQEPPNDHASWYQQDSLALDLIRGFGKTVNIRRSILARHFFTCRFNMSYCGLAYVRSGSTVTVGNSEQLYLKMMSLAGLSNN